MGYRSNVVCLMYGNNDIGDNTIVKEFVRSRVEAYSDSAHPEAADHVRNSFNYNGWGVMFKADDWKWYDNYPDIQFLENLFDEFEELLIGDDASNTSYALEFVRLGEESDDIEERMRGAVEGRTWINRCIEVDGG
jgi:hypothetical protein